MKAVPLLKKPQGYTVADVKPLGLSSQPGVDASPGFRGKVEGKIIVGPPMSPNFHIAHITVGPEAVLSGHWHDFDQVYFTLKGKGATSAEGQDFEMKPNSLVYLPMGVLHETRNTGDEPLVYLNVSSPPAFTFPVPDHPVSENSKPKWIAEPGKPVGYMLEDIELIGGTPQVGSAGGPGYAGSIEARFAASVKYPGVRNFHIAHIKLGPGTLLNGHFHDFDQCYFTLSGQGVTRVSGRDFPMTPGSLVFLPEGTVHETRVTGEQVVYINVSSPPASSFEFPDYPCTEKYGVRPQT
jgi:mannose-6-phosphate isomerase-like protein (cupin superfamily)